jgi:hypothetical protein
MSTHSLATDPAGDIIMDDGLFPDEDARDEALYSEPRDPVSAVLGSDVYIANATVDGCVETFAGGLEREPERFDRFYFEPEPVLIDVLEARSEQELEAERQDKHVAFKTAWCRDHDRRYVVLTAEQADDVALARSVLGGETEKPKAERPRRKPRRRAVARRRARARCASRRRRAAARRRARARCSDRAASRRRRAAARCSDPAGSRSAQWQRGSRRRRPTRSPRP